MAAVCLSTLVLVLFVAAFLLESESSLVKVAEKRGAAGVFMLIDGGSYTLNFSAATAACLSLNVTMATRAQMERAVQQGLETCKFGWIHERVAVVPRLKSDQNCGQGKTGLVLWFAAEDRKFAVYCFNASDLEESLQTSTTQAQTFMFSTRRTAPTQTSASTTAQLKSTAPPPRGETTNAATAAVSLLLGATRSDASVPAPPPSSTHVPAPEPSTHVPAPPPSSTHVPAPHPSSTHVPAPEPSSTHVPAPPPSSTHVPAPHPSSTRVPAPPPSSTHVPAPEPPSTHIPAPHPSSTHVPASLHFFISAGVRPQSVNSPAALPSGLAVGGVVLLLLTAAAAWLHKRRVCSWSQQAQREAADTEMWKHMDDEVDVSQSEEEEEEEEEALDRKFSSEVQLCVNPHVHANSSE